MSEAIIGHNLDRLIDRIDETYKPTRRDYFAAAAMTGLLIPGSSSYDHSITSLALKYADYMIEELDKVSE